MAYLASNKIGYIRESESKKSEKRERESGENAVHAKKEFGPMEIISHVILEYVCFSFWKGKEIRKNKKFGRSPSPRHFDQDPPCYPFCGS